MNDPGHGLVYPGGGGVVALLQQRGQGHVLGQGDAEGLILGAQPVQEPQGLGQALGLGEGQLPHVADFPVLALLGLENHIGQGAAGVLQKVGVAHLFGWVFAEKGSPMAFLPLDSQVVLPQAGVVDGL